MRFLRGRFLGRFLSIFFLLLFIHSIFTPYYAFALTSGPHQPEYTSYEDAGSTDMVNLVTGDFTFNVPLLNVPGPEGDFALPLSYHAGIGLEQEASWVGLGFNINAGAILRNINQYPDDASGEGKDINVKDLTGVNGWNRIFNHPFRDDWNSRTGYHGNVNLLDIVEADFGNTTNVGIVGIHVSENGVGFNPVQFTNALISITSWGVGSGASALSVTKQAAMSLAVSSAVSFASPVNTPGGSGLGADLKYSKSSHATIEFNKWASFASGVPVLSRKKSWKIWLDQTRTENMYGVLYSGNVRTSDNSGYTMFLNNIDHEVPLKFYPLSTQTSVANTGAASDINFDIDNGQPYDKQFTPTSLATDDYAVNAPGVHGSITPIRLEVGSVALPRAMSDRHIRFAPIPYLNNYKVPFIYEGGNANRYFHQVGSQALLSETGPAKPEFFWGSLQASHVSFMLFDRVLENRIGQNVVNSKIPQGNNIEWLSNSEIKSALESSQVCPQKFIDFLSGNGANGDYKYSDRYKFRVSNVLGSAGTPEQGIGGYSITASDGVTYHFALPVYDYAQVSVSTDIKDTNKSATITRNSPFANTWLLTAITGPDFIDRNQNGLADEGDWGYWVKMNYGKHTDSFDWRIPYQGDITDATNTYRSSEQGKKQLYYLNSIETRSHVALFMKSNREDGLSANGSVTSLKLDEICLLGREEYKKLWDIYGIRSYSNKISYVCLSSEFTPLVRDYINRNCSKRILFNYSYDLCKGTPNTTANNTQKGKLTLKRISVRGRNDLLIVPDYKFDYSYNPNYGANSWDGWGIFNPTGNSSPSSHITNDPAGGNGAAWSLVKVTTPLGSEVAINYERDSYTSISGEPVFDPTVKTYSKVNYTEPYNPDIFKKIDISHNNFFSPGDRIKLSGEILFKCPRNADYTNVQVQGDYTITAVTAQSITLDRNFVNDAQCLQSYTELTQVTRNGGTITKYSKGKNGGNVRVASIVMKDEFGKENKLRYLYTKTDGTSSGVVAQEPDYIRTSNFAFYNYLRYPQTPVMYSRVSVLSGILSSDTDFNSKQVFEFETPNKSQFSYSPNNDMQSKADRNEFNKFHKIEDRTSKIGSLKSIQLYDKNGKLISGSQLFYTDNNVLNKEKNNYQGTYAESTILAERVAAEEVVGNQPDVVRIAKTTFINYPWVLTKIVNTKDGFSTTSQNISYDLLTGHADETLDKSSLGVYVKTVVIPAYSLTNAQGEPLYSDFGSKAYNVNNKNMLSQNAAIYTYLSDISGTQIGLISAQAQTWKKDWSNYRALNASGYIDEGVQNFTVWRKGPAYIWKGDYLRYRSDGANNFSKSDEFNFTGSNPLWQYAGEIKRFDHYSMPLEAVDMNGIASSVKMGYDDRLIIAAASNAQYNEIAFSSAEDKIPGQVYFGGEVGIGTGAVVNTPIHTGNTALKIPSTTATGFVFRTNDLKASKEYRASVWANSTTARLYTRINNGTIVVPTGQTISSAIAIPGMGNWYRIDYSFQCPASVTTFEIGVKSTSGVIVVDDFRFQPVDATMTCYVHPPLDFQFSSTSSTYSHFSYILDDDNLFTKYEINEKGEIVKIYRESLKYGVKQVSESKSNYRRSNINQ